MGTCDILLNAANKHEVFSFTPRNPRLWGLIQKTYCEDKITWQQFNHLTGIMSSKGEFMLNSTLLKMGK